jgi:hypothetical protein
MRGQVVGFGGVKYTVTGFTVITKRGNNEI